MYLLRYLFSYCHACFERWLILGLQGIYTLHLCTSVIESRMLSCNFFRKDTNNEDLQNLQNLNRGFVVHYCLLFSFSWVYMELTVSYNFYVWYETWLILGLQGIYTHYFQFDHSRQNSLHLQLHWRCKHQNFSGV